MQHASYIIYIKNRKKKKFTIINPPLRFGRKNNLRRKKVFVIILFHPKSKMGPHNLISRFKMYGHDSNILLNDYDLDLLLTIQPTGSYYTPNQTLTETLNIHN